MDGCLVFFLCANIMLFPFRMNNVQCRVFIYSQYTKQHHQFCRWLNLKPRPPTFSCILTCQIIAKMDLISVPFVPTTQRTRWDGLEWNETKGDKLYLKEWFSSSFMCKHVESFYSQLFTHDTLTKRNSFHFVFVVVVVVFELSNWLIIFHRNCLLVDFGIKTKNECTIVKTTKLLFKMEIN